MSGLKMIVADMLVMAVTAKGALWLVKRLEGAYFLTDKRDRAFCALMLLSGGICVSQTAGEALAEHLLMATAAGAMLFACVTDRACQMVYCFTWWIAGVAVGLVFLLRMWAEHPSLSGWGIRLMGLAGFFLIQELFFGRLYGRADCHAFEVGAVMLSAWGGGMAAYFLHMTISFLLLIPVQLARHNVGRRGELRSCAAFLPYIVPALWITVYLCRYCCFFL